MTLESRRPAWSRGVLHHLFVPLYAEVESGGLAGTCVEENRVRRGVRVDKSTKLFPVILVFRFVRVVRMCSGYQG